MLVIRKEQLAVLQNEALRRYKRTLSDKMQELKEAFPNEFPPLPKKELPDLIGTFVDEARCLAMKSERDIAIFACLRLQCADFYSCHTQRFRNGFLALTDPQERSDYIQRFFKEAIAEGAQRHA